MSGMCPVGALCAPCLIGGLGQAHQYAHDAGVFVRCRIKEQSVVHKTGDGCDRSVLLGSSWPNNGDRPEVCAEEQGGLGHDQIGLKQIGDSRTFAKDADRLRRFEQEAKTKSRINVQSEDL